MSSEIRMRSNSCPDPIESQKVHFFDVKKQMQIETNNHALITRINYQAFLSLLRQSREK